MTLKLENAEFYGGTLSIDASARTGEGGLAARASLEVASSKAARALNDLAGISALAGTATVSLTLSGAGKSWGELARNVNGNGDIALDDGALVGFDLGKAIAALDDPLAEPIAAGDARTEFRSMGAHLVLREGTITTGDLTMTGAGYALNLAGSGSVFGGTVAGEGRLFGGGESVPIAVDGTWSDPTLTRRTYSPPSGQGDQSRP